MALFECVECGGKVSTAAERCPHCGHPNSNRVLIRPQEPELPKPKRLPYPPPSPQTPRSKRSIGKTLGIGVFFSTILLVIISILIASFNETESNKPETPQKTEIKSKTADRPITLYAKTVADIRSNASLTSAIVRQTAKGEKLDGAYKRGSWYKLEPRDAIPGHWIHESVVTETFSEVAKKTTATNSSPSVARKNTRSPSTPPGQKQIASDGYIGCTNRKYFEKKWESLNPLFLSIKYISVSVEIRFRF